MSGNDVEIVIGAKDQASRILRDVGNSSKQMSQTIKTSAAGSVKANKSVELSFASLKAAAGPLLAAYAAFKGVTAGFRIIGDSAAAFDKQREAVRGLTMALEQSGASVAPSAGQLQGFAAELSNVTGVGEGVTAGLLKQASAMGVSTDKLKETARAAIELSSATGQTLDASIKQVSESMNPTIGQLEKFAAQMQKVTNVGDEVTLGLMKQASMMGVSSDKLKDVTRAAVGLSEATGQSLDDSLRKVNDAINGNASSMARYLPEIRNAATEEERLAIVLRASERGLEQKAAKAGEAAGSGERLANSWGDFLEVIGEALAPVRAFISTGLAVLVETIQTAVIPALASIMPSAETVAGAMARMRSAVVQAVTVVEVVVGNLGVVWELASTSALFAVTRIVEDVKHAFTSTIPQYVSWFAENFTTLVGDAFNAAVTIISNRIRQMGDIVLALWDFVKSGFSGGASKLFTDVGAIASRNLLEGFEAQTKELPKIMARDLTSGESAMVSKMGALAGKLAGEYGSKLSDRMKEAGEDGGKEILAGINLSANESIEIAKDAAAEAAKMQKVASTQSLSATESRLQTRGSADQAQDRTAKNTEVMIRKLEEIARILPDIKPEPSENTLQLEVVS